MPSAVGVMGEVASAAASLAGLILVFIGALGASYGSYDRTAQKSVRGGFQRRAWIAFIGFLLCLSAVALALSAKWLSCQPVALAASGVLTLALAWVIYTALSAVREIK